MAAKTKAKPAAKKSKPVKKAAPKKAAPKKAAVKKTAVPKKATVKKAVTPRKPRRTKLEKGLAEIAGETAAGSKRIVARSDWFIVNIYVDNGFVFGLANDQRVYRWNTRSALWVLHKEGLQP